MDLSAPLIPLTLRAMSRTRIPRARRSGLPVFSLLSVLVVLAFACFPVLAQAEEATGPVYEPEVPTVPSEESPGGSHHGGSGGGGSAGISGTPGGGGSGTGGGQGGGSHTGQGNQGAGTESAKPGDGSGGAGAGGIDGNQEVKLGENTASATADDSSSPLVPILIAIVVLAAISIGAYYYRQRRQGAGSPVSPKAS